MQLAASIGLCGRWLIDATLNADAAPSSHAVRTHYGKYTPRFDADFAVLSTGVVADEKDPGFVSPQPGTAFANSTRHPAPLQDVHDACDALPDSDTVYDEVFLDLTIRAPTNAKGAVFDWMFLSAEYPEHVGSQFNDSFLALVDGRAFQGNAAFDGGAHRVTVNSVHFDACDSAEVCPMVKNACARLPDELDGTGYELHDGDGARVGAGTGWLGSQFAVARGDVVKLRLAIFDGGDHLVDSAVVLDGFGWTLVPSSGLTSP